MSARDGDERHDPPDPLAALHLPRAIYTQAGKRLMHIAQARSARDCERAADLAEGFGLGLETVKALNAAILEALYLLFEHAAAVRLRELEP